MGTSLRELKYATSSKDHPHAYGDKLDVLASLLTVVGSSPRVWGQVRGLYIAAVRVWIIPTRVGTSLIRFVYIISNKDHPHACGDKPAFSAVRASIEGSSPRVWGQALCF